MVDAPFHFDNAGAVTAKSTDGVMTGRSPDKIIFHEGVRPFRCLL
jgi:hypothetical protein